MLTNSVKPILLLIIICSLSTAVRAKIFFPTDINELILDIDIANSNNEDDIIDLCDCVFKIVKVHHEDPTNGPNGLPDVESDSNHSLTVKNGTIERDPFIPGLLTRHIQVNANAHLILENMKLRYGLLPDQPILNRNGGSILNFGRLSINYSEFSLNAAPAATVIALHGGGAIANYSVLSVKNSTFNSNWTQSYGGAILNANLIELIANSTFFNNASLFDGGAIENLSTTINLLVNNTIYGNRARFGGGVDNFLGTIKGFVSNIVAGNTATASGPDIDNTAGNLVNPLYNLIGNIQNNNIPNSYPAAPFNQVGGGPNPVLDPHLGPLQNNGGPTQTMALLPNSTAINAGANPLSFRFDQRGPGYLRVRDGQTDVGAFEVQNCHHDSDMDHDGVCCDADNCPCVYNPDQLESDRNDIGADCDSCLKTRI